MHTFRDFEALSKAGDVGRLVSIHGQVVEKGDVKTVLTHIAFRCITKNAFEVECGTIQLVEQDVERGEMIKPSKCYHCEAQKPKFVKLDSQESKSEAIQRLTIQQEQVSSDSKQIMVELRGDLCDTIEAGNSTMICLLSDDTCSCCIVSLWIASLLDS
jgi:DNA replicative helicase MCM subunit Mcm2 (Cdc46/Mcm family)